MPIITIDGLLAGMLPNVVFAKTAQTFEGAGIWASNFYQAGFPGPAVISTAGIAGEALTSYPGQMRFPAAVGGKEIRLAKIEAAHSSGVGYLALMDRLWHNNGYSVTLTTSQTIDSVAWPARDANGATLGAGVSIAMEAAATLGSGTPTLTVTYTNSAGTAGRVGTIGPISTTSQPGSWYAMSMAAGDVGVRSVQSIQSSATMTSGAVSFVAFRQIAGLPMGAANVAIDRDAIALGVPLAYDNTVPFLVYLPTATSATSVDGTLIWAQG